MQPVEPISGEFCGRSYWFKRVRSTPDGGKEERIAKPTCPHSSGGLFGYAKAIVVCRF
jgi:hypothetical protein